MNGCTAPRHGTRRAYDLGCRCPDTYDVIRPMWRRKSARKPRTGGHCPTRPGSDVDEVAIERACAGEAIPLNRVERRIAVARLTALRLSLRQIAERLHLSDRTVLRHRSQHRQNTTHGRTAAA